MRFGFRASIKLVCIRSKYRRTTTSRKYEKEKGTGEDWDKRWTFLPTPLLGSDFLMTSDDLLRIAYKIATATATHSELNCNKIERQTNKRHYHVVVFLACMTSQTLTRLHRKKKADEEEKRRKTITNQKLQMNSKTGQGRWISMMVRGRHQLIPPSKTVAPKPHKSFIPILRPVVQDILASVPTRKGGRMESKNDGENKCVLGGFFFASLKASHQSYTADTSYDDHKQEP